MFETLFSYSRSTFAQSELLPSTSFSLQTLVILLVALVLVVLFSLLRSRRQLTALQLITVGLLQVAAIVLAGFMLGQPVLQLDTLRPGDNKVGILLDTSRSMALSDDGENTRLQAALPIVQEDLLEPLQETYQVELRSFGSELGSLTSLESLPRPAPRTELAGSLTATLEAAKTESVGAVILISDGSDNGGINATWYAELASAGIPVHSVGIGREVLTEDIEIAAVQLPQRAVPEVNVNALVQVRSGSAGAAELKVYDGNEILASESISLTGNGQVSQHSVRIPTGELGVRQLRFVIDPAVNERILVNNTYHHPLTVSAREPRVLYVEGEPRWEYKFIRRAVENENFLHLHTLLRTSPNRIYRQGIENPQQLANGFPTERDELFQYDTLMIGTQEAASFTPEQLELVKQFVGDRGGSILFLGGRRSLSDGDWQNTTVADLLPVVLPQETGTFVREQVEVRPTALGYQSDWLRFTSDESINQERWGALPAIGDYQRIGRVKPGAVTLLEALVAAESLPLLVTQRYGRGKVMVLATGGTWRWQMQLPSEDDSHEVFWRQLLQELVAETPRQVDFYTSQSWYRDDPNLEMSARIRTTDFEPKTDAENGRLYVLETETASLEAIEGVFAELRQNMRADDRLQVYLVGHGSFDGEDYKFNIQGPDLSGQRLAELLDSLPEGPQLVTVMTSASGALQETLPGDNRVVITATKSGLERNAPVFGEYWVSGLSDPAADINKNELLSALEIYQYTTDQVASHYSEENLLASEHALISDETAANNFTVARAGLLASGRLSIAAESLLQERTEVEEELQTLMSRRAEIPEDQYFDQLQELMLELGRLQERIDEEVGSNAP